MQKFLVSVMTIACVAPLESCNRHSSPTAAASITSQGAALQAIEILGGSADDEPLQIGQTRQLSAVARLVDGSEQDITSLATWTSLDSAVATVTSGLVTAVGAGTGCVRASYQRATGETTLRVVDNPSDSNPSPTADSAPGSSSDDGSSPTPPPGSSPTPGSGPGSSPIPGAPPTVHSLTITGDHTVPAGRSTQLRAIAHMSDGSEKDVTGSSDWRNERFAGRINLAGWRVHRYRSRTERRVGELQRRHRFAARAGYAVLIGSTMQSAGAECTGP